MLPNKQEGKPWYQDEFIKLLVAYNEGKSREVYGHTGKEIRDMLALIARIESTTRAEAMRECAEIARDAQFGRRKKPVDKDNPLWEAIIKGKKDTYNTACSDIALSIESRIKE